MYLKFLQVNLEGFMSIGSMTINLADQGSVLVKGDNQCNEAYSNGSGKSSIFEGIIWCLTGSSLRGSLGVNDIINRNYKSYCKVSVEFEYNKDHYIVTRTRKDPQLGSTLLISINGKDVSKKSLKDTSQYLLQLIPQLSIEILSSVIILGQGLPNKFSSMNSNARKDYLEQITNLSSGIDLITMIYDQYKSDLSEKLEVSTKELYQIKGQVSQLNTLKTSNESKIEQYYQKEVKIQETTSITELSELLDNESVKLNQLISSVKLLESNLHNVNTLLAELSTKRNSIIQYEYPKYLSDTECPLCHQSLPPEVIKSNKTAISKLDAEIKELDNQIQVLNNKKSDLSNLIKDQESQVNQSTNKVQNLQLQIQSVQSQSDSQVVSAQIEYLKNENKNYQEQIMSLSDREVSLQSDIDTQSDYISKINKLSRLVNKEFKSYLLLDIVTFINQLIKQYSDKIIPSSTVKLELSKSGKIEIYKDTTIYELLSGGEKRRIDLIVQFAIRHLMSELTNFHCNLLVLDEIFDNLDKEGCDRVIELINTQFYDVDSQYIISHRIDLNLYGDKELTVVKNKLGISELYQGGLLNESNFSNTFS